MKKVITIAVLLFLISYCETVLAQNSSPYQIGTWPGFRSCAISYTFDDGCANQFTKAVPIFNEFDYKMTLFTVSGWITDWTNLKNAAASGHEVANHTASHPNFNTQSIAQQDSELTICNKKIETNIPGQKCVTMAYPYCAKGNDALHRKYFIAARGCQGFTEPKNPGDFMNVSSAICGELGSVKKASDFKSRADLAAAQKGWLVYLLHGVDNDGGYSPVSSDTLKKSLQYLKDNDSKFWVTSFGDAARYVKERNCARVTETFVSDTTITITVNDTLTNEEIFNLPLTVRRSLPEGWSYAKVTKNNVPVNDTIYEENAVKYVQFDVLPDEGSIVITKVIRVGSNDLKGSINKLQIQINSNNLRFTLPESCCKNPSASVYNLKGEKLLNVRNVETDYGYGQIFIGSIARPGIYLLQLTDHMNSWSGKFVL